MKKRLEFNIDFMGKYKLFMTISSVLIVLAFGVIFTKGLKYGIDFSGGTNVIIQVPSEVTIDSVRETAGKVSAQTEVQSFGDDNKGEFLILMQNEKGTNEQGAVDAGSKRLTDAFKEAYGQDKVKMLQIETVGAKVGQEFKQNGLMSILLSMIVILVYVAFRFNLNFAPGAVLCLFHDVIITAGLFALLGKEFNLSIIAAFLTIVGYSLNDTIVVYDRIRETMLKHSKHKTLIQIINLSINQTLPRTTFTALTTLFTTLCLYFLGGGLIKEFALAMSIGIIIGTYSSIFIASPFIIIYEYFYKQFTTAKVKHA